MKRSSTFEKSNTKHSFRNFFKFHLDDGTYQIVLTKHGHFRTLRNQKIDFDTFAQIILSIGNNTFKEMFAEALTLFPLEKRTHIEWERQVDYCIAIYNVIHESVYILGLHPHLQRITIVTIIPRIDNVFADVFHAFRVDNSHTLKKVFNYQIKNEIELRRVFLDINN